MSGIDFPPGVACIPFLPQLLAALLEFAYDFFSPRTRGVVTHTHGIAPRLAAALWRDLFVLVQHPPTAAPMKNWRLADWMRNRLIVTCRAYRTVCPMSRSAGCGFHLLYEP